uniref:Uncharacterized protein n=1 Tax=Desertifilum tharense IPPAS B-1220 TaxID=1781255 RepID=A0ACD5GZC4_9CYAN
MDGGVLQLGEDVGNLEDVAEFVEALGEGVAPGGVLGLFVFFALAVGVVLFVPGF